jgi:hypothetical protein
VLPALHIVVNTAVMRLALYTFGCFWLQTDAFQARFSVQNDAFTRGSFQALASFSGASAEQAQNHYARKDVILCKPLIRQPETEGALNALEGIYESADC